MKITRFCGIPTKYVAKQTNSQPSELFDEKQYNLIGTQKLYLTIPITETTNIIELPLFMMRRSIRFVKMLKQHLRSVVTLACLIATAPVISTK